MIPSSPFVILYFFTVAFASNFIPCEDSSSIQTAQSTLTDTKAAPKPPFPLAPIVIPSPSTDFLGTLKPPSRTSPVYRQPHRSPFTPNHRPVSPTSLPRWLVSSASLIDSSHFSPVVYAELKGSSDILRLLSEAVMASSPSVEFLFHKSDSFTGYHNYQAAGKSAFASIFQGVFDPRVIAAVLQSTLNDHICDQHFVVLSLLNSGTGFFELILFTSIDSTDYETLDRVLHVFSRLPGLSTMFPTSAQELVQNRIKIMHELARRNFKLNGSPARKNITWTKYMSLLGNLPRSPPTTKSPNSPRNSNSQITQKRSPPPLKPPIIKCPLSIINPDDLETES